MTLSYADLICNELILLISNEIFDGNCWENDLSRKDTKY